MGWLNINGNWIGRHSGRSWSSYWATHFAEFQTTLFAQDDLNFWAKSRSGLTFVDEYGNDASILVPTAYFNGTDNKLSGSVVVGGNAWDCTIKVKLHNAAGNSPLLNCGGYTGVVKGLMMRVNNGTLQVFTSDGTTAVSANFATGLTNDTLYTIRVQWSGVTGETMTVTTNGAALTSTTNKGWADNSTNALCFANYATIYGNITLVEATGTFGNLVFSLFPNGLSTEEIGIAATPVKLSWAGAVGHSVYDTGSAHYLDNGFSIWKDNSDIYQYVPNDLSGNFLDVDALLAGTYANISQIAGSVNHNLWNSYIRFAGDFFDRSNTTIWNDTSRESAYYSESTPKDFYITELNFKTLKTWLNVGYKGKFFIKADEQSVEDTTTIDELFCYTTDKTSHDEIKALIYSNDVRRCQRNTSGDYIFDSDNYAEIYLYDDLGGDAEANYTKYQALINSGDLTLVTGYNEYDVIALSQPLSIPSNRTITINCELRIKDGTIVNLTQNVTAGDTVIHVDSVDGFNIGEWVAIGDDLLQQCGGIQTRRFASCGRITEIGENTITIHAASRYDVSAGDNGQLGHAQSVLLIDEKENVTINGTGIINGNWENQYDKEPVNAVSEEQKMFCGISSVLSNGTVIDGALLIKNAGTHGISMVGDMAIASRVSDCVIKNVTCDRNHDKNILLVSTDGVEISDVTCTNSPFEDGIIFYLNNINMVVSRVTCLNNVRNDFTINSNGVCNGVFNDIIAIKTSISSSSLVVNGLTNSHLRIDSSYSGGNDIIINNYEVSDLSTTSVLTIYGAVDNIVFNEAILDGCTTSGAAIVIDDLNDGGVFPQNIEFIGGGIYDHTGDAYAIAASADVTFTDFDNAPA